MDGFASYGFLVFPLGLKNGKTLVPQFRLNNGFYSGMNPIFFRLEFRRFAYTF